MNQETDPHKSFGFFTAICRGFEFLEIWVSGLSFVGMFLVVLAAIVMRFVLKIPFFWGEEASRYFMLVGVYFGMSIAVREKAHLGVDIVVNFLPSKVARFVHFIALVITTAVYCVMAKICFDFTNRMWHGTQISPAMSIPMWIVYGVIFVGFVLCFLESFFLIWKEFFIHPAPASIATTGKNSNA